MKSIQAVVFSRSVSPAEINDGKGWTADDAAKWAADSAEKLEQIIDFRFEEGSVQLRQLPVNEFAAGSLQVSSEDCPAGVAFVVGEKRGASIGEPERRIIELEEESIFRVEERNGEIHMEGYVARYNVWSQEMGIGPYRFRERIEPGFFDSAIGKSDVRCLLNHDPNYVLARKSAGTLALRSDDKGLWADARLDAESMMVDCMVIRPMRRRELRGASFSFSLAKDGAEQREGSNGLIEQVLKKAASVDDVGPVQYPAYPQTNLQVAKRALDIVAQEAELRELIARAERQASTPVPAADDDLPCGEASGEWICKQPKGENHRHLFQPVDRPAVVGNGYRLSLEIGG